MRRYEVQITREAMVSMLVHINADDKDEAEVLAREKLCEPQGMASEEWWVLDHEWTTSDCEYSTEELK
jgi:hypothetical protein